MFCTKARHLQRVRNTASGLFRQLLDFRIGVVMCHHHGISLFEKTLDFLTVELLFIHAQRNRLRREGIDCGFRIKHHAHYGFSFYWLNNIAFLLPDIAKRRAIVFCILNKIANLE